MWLWRGEDSREARARAVLKMKCWRNSEFCLISQWSRWSCKKCNLVEREEMLLFRFEPQNFGNIHPTLTLELIPLQEKQRALRRLAARAPFVPRRIRAVLCEVVWNGNLKWDMVCQHKGDPPSRPAPMHDAMRCDHVMPLWAGNSFSVALKDSDCIWKDLYDNNDLVGVGDTLCLCVFLSKRWILVFGGFAEVCRSDSCAMIRCASIGRIHFLRVFPSRPSASVTCCHAYLPLVGWPISHPDNHSPLHLSG